MTSQGMEDYLEAILELGKDKTVETKEIAEKLEVKQPSVSEMLQKLEKRNYIIYKRYKGAKLTEKGKKIAKQITETHDSIKKLFMFLGVDEEKAERDACRVEHELTQETIKKLKDFLEFLEINEGSNFLEEYYRFLE